MEGLVLDFPFEMYRYYIRYDMSRVYIKLWIFEGPSVSKVQTVQRKK
jgi:hypothetical protein